MRKQKQIWEKEHNSQTTLAALEKDKASSFVKSFVYYLKKHGVPLEGNAIDIGCGKGRNAIYLALEGLYVYALDYIKSATSVGLEQAKENHVEDKITFSNRNIDEAWEFPDNFFDFAIDCFSSIDIETKKGRMQYRSELLRTLKPQGYALVVVVSAHDEMEKELQKKYPAQENNSVYWPENGKFQKNYDEKELRDFYKSFKIVVLKKINKPTFKRNKSYIATNFWMVLQKQ